MAPTQTSAVPAFYLEVPAIGGTQNKQYLNQLEAKGFHAIVGKDVGGAAHCILIGPYVDRALMAQAQRKLNAAGILAIEAAD